MNHLIKTVQSLHFVPVHTTRLVCCFVGLILVIPGFPVDCIGQQSSDDAENVARQNKEWTKRVMMTNLLTHELHKKAILEDLKLSEKQKLALSLAREKSKDATSYFLFKYPKLRQQIDADKALELRKFVDGFEQKLHDEILNKQQSKRFRQIRFQSSSRVNNSTAGIIAPADRENQKMIEVLSLTETQLANVKKIHESNKKEVKQIIGEYEQKIAKLKLESFRTAMDLLTDDQKAEIKKLMGERFGK